MESVRKSAEHHFLTILQKLKKAPQGWALLYFGFSRLHSHKDLIKNPFAMNKALSSGREQAEAMYQQLFENTQVLAKGYLYFFDDNDILILCPFRGEEDRLLLQGIYKNAIQGLDQQLCDFGILEHEFYNYQKLADQKFLSARRISAYREMADKLKVGSIPVRRDRRDHPLVQVIEDDRFTSSYAANILNREYDIILSRHGEDGIIHYIENAPDIVLIDIHLPGLSGHEVLESIRAIDPNAFAVMLSVDTMKSNIMQAAEGGANNFLKKPFSKERLLNIVKTSPYIQSIMRRNSSSLTTQ